MEHYGEPLQPEDLKSHRLVAFVPTHQPRPMRYRRNGEEISINTRSAVASFTNGDAMTDAVAARIGIAQIPTFYVEHALEKGRLRQILVEQDAHGSSIQLVYPSRTLVPRRVRALADFLVDAKAGAPI